MRYDAFRDRWLAALHRAGFLSHHDRSEETIDLSTTERRWRAYRLAVPLEPLQAGATVSFRWDPFDSARSYTQEEDLLTELLGRRRSTPVTQPRLVRVDVRFRATHLVYGSTIALPPRDVWVPWLASMEERLDAALTARRPHRRAAEVPAWRGELEVDSRCAPSGAFQLQGMSVPAFEMIVVPRVWDDPKRRDREPSADRQIDGLARRFRQGVDAWIASVGELVTWLRHTPGGPRTAPRRRRGGYFPDDSDGGPEVMH